MSEAPVVVEYRQIRLGRSNASVSELSAKRFHSFHRWRTLHLQVDITNGLVVDNYRPEATTAVTLRVLFNGQELPAPLSEELGMVPYRPFESSYQSTLGGRERTEALCVGSAWNPGIFK